MSFKRSLLFIPLAALLVFSRAYAASVLVTANQKTVMIGQPFRIDVSLDTSGDDANAIQGELDFPASQFSVQNILDGASPVNFWITPPMETASGVISFSGIVPGGFKGAATSVISVWFMPLASGTGMIALHDLQLLRNDGQGSPIALETSTPVGITVSSVIATSTPTRPVSLIVPNAFTPIVSQDPNIDGGEYFLAFSTTDKGSGIDHYEVLEVPTGGGTGVTGDWRVATSPYVLQDQSLSSDIYVRAIDHDGNFIVVRIPAQNPFSRQSALNRWAWFMAVLGAIIMLAVIVLRFMRRLGRRRRI